MNMELLKQPFWYSASAKGWKMRMELSTQQPQISEICAKTAPIY